MELWISIFWIKKRLCHHLWTIWLKIILIMVSIVVNVLVVLRSCLVLGCCWEAPIQTEAVVVWHCSYLTCCSTYPSCQSTCCSRCPGWNVVPRIHLSVDMLFKMSKLAVDMLLKMSKLAVDMLFKMSKLTCRSSDGLNNGEAPFQMETVENTGAHLRI